MVVRARLSITNWLHQNYVKPDALYHVAGGADGGGLDNPDMRITQDVDRLCEQLRHVLEELAIEPLLMAYYTYAVASVGGAFSPLFIYAYFCVTFLFCRVLVGPLLGLVAQRERAEGDLRFHHVRVRTHAEAISMMRGEEIERLKLDARLDTAIRLQKRIVFREMILKLGTECVNYGGAILPYCIIAVPIFAGKYDHLPGDELSSLISKNLFISMYLIWRFTATAKLFERIAEMAGYASRIGELMELLDSFQHDKLGEIRIDEQEPLLTDHAADSNPTQHGSTEGASSSRQAISVTNLTYATPTGHILVRNLTFELEPTETIFITGPSGSGKSSLLRVLSGLWDATGGTIQLPPPHTLFFSPQQPYLVSRGTLAEQICYPDAPPEGSDDNDEITRVLEEAEIAYLLSRPGARRRSVGSGEKGDTFDGDWSVGLSPGERQRLAFARVLYHRPDFALLDEATSNVDPDVEARLYRRARERGIACVVVGHRELEGFKRRIVLDGRGGWVQEGGEGNLVQL
ncbi:ATP-binding cassette sub- D member 4 [Borealophlyctis nickersoniae]|nr:ATP-binding cassette sub- D member 4 [Borealophlyctis nickersoniae]